MARSPGIVRPFAGLRPAPGRAADIAAPPYDVVTEGEARTLVRAKPWSFLRVSRPEVDFPPGIDPHADDCYAKAAANLKAMQERGLLIRDHAPCYYAYRVSAAGHVQTGIAAAGSLADYATNRIRRHELTRPDKETDRVRQILAVEAHTGPVFAAHPSSPALDAVLARATAGTPAADAHVGAVRHQLWVVSEPAEIAAVTAAFEDMEAIYIADGHHRSAAAARVAAERPECDRFLLVSFPVPEVRILDYNRVVRDLGGLGEAEFLSRLGAAFEIAPSAGPVRPERRAIFGLYLGGRWRRLTLRAPLDPAALPQEQLDVALLTRHILEPILGIGDPRTDPRIDFVGGARGLESLEHKVDGEGFAAAFSLHPTSMEDLIAVADAGAIMPPKSTWFEPKLADGMISLPLE